MLGVAVAIKLTSRGPVLFTQYRYGYMKRLFRMHKFRTMVADAEQLHAGLEGHNEASGPVFKIRNDPRVTPIGRFLRRTSLDELPQIWHVLTGEMSLVGPRPTADPGREPVSRAVADAAVQRAARADLPLADQRAEQRRLRSMDRARPGVHRQLVIVARSEDPDPDPSRDRSRNGSDVRLLTAPSHCIWFRRPGIVAGAPSWRLPTFVHDSTWPMTDSGGRSVDLVPLNSRLILGMRTDATSYADAATRVLDWASTSGVALRLCLRTCTCHDGIIRLCRVPRDRERRRLGDSGRNAPGVGLAPVRCCLKRHEVRGPTLT